MFKIPVVVRKHDGAILRPGTVVSFGLKILVIRHVHLSNDLQKMTLSVAEFNGISEVDVIPEEIILNIDEATPIPKWQVEEPYLSLSKDIAADSTLELLNDMYLTPLHVKHVARKMTLAARIRRSVKHFLQGLEMIGTINLGLLDWDHDPMILGLSSTCSKFIYRIEDCNANLGGANTIDDFLGSHWDMLDLSATMVESFRIILTLEIYINENADICISVHAALCQQKPELGGDNGCYRSQYLKQSTENSNSIQCHSMSLPNSPDQEANKTSLLWDSFSMRKEPHRLSTPLLEDSPDDDEEAQGETLMEDKENPNTTTASEELKSDVFDEELKFQMPANNASMLSGSESSRAQSRFSGISHSTGASRLPRLQGFFQRGQVLAKTEEVVQCPFPNDWQFGTVPEVIANDEEVD